VTDSDYMARALALAERGRGGTSPNPMVGALVVDAEGVVVGRGSHQFAGGAHAEIHALEDAGPRARGATLYCTLEPCSHTGRTAPCAPRVVQAGIRRAVVAMEDPNPLVAGRGIAHLKEHGIEVTVGVRAGESAALNRPFCSVMRRQRPFVTAKVALSLDACVAAAGRRTRITGAAADRRVHRERAETDAIAIGSGTLLADDPLLTARGVYRKRPLVRVIFDRRLRTPPDARVLSTLDAGPVIIVTTTSAVEGHPNAATALAGAGARLQIHDSEDGRRPLLGAALTRLVEHGVTSIVIEGGPTLHRAAWEEGVVDRVEMFVAPHAVGAGGVPWMTYETFALTDLVDVTAEPVGDDVLIQGFAASDVHRAR
jgi:diaminohydroxyphosphoribosylaminopyrimidine deaminase / 5-amino-6-(5-phosphoribosylamino)uracil reductase